MVSNVINRVRWHKVTKEISLILDSQFGAGVHLSWVLKASPLREGIEKQPEVAQGRNELDVLKSRKRASVAECGEQEEDGMGEGQREGPGQGKRLACF